MERYKKLPSQNEETVKIQVVIPFLKFLGYQESWFIGEEKVLSKRNRVDIAVCVNQYNSDVLYVETKKAGKQLVDSDVEQLLNYLNIINVEWGILTNGKDYLLLNNKIDGEYRYKIVFNFNLKDGSTGFMLNFFTYEYIFDRKVTNYFKYLAQFKAYKNVINEKDMS